MLKKLFIMLFWLPLALAAQPELAADTSRAVSLFEEANRFYRDARFDLAQVKYRDAFTIYDTLNMWDKKLQCLVRVAACYARKGDFDGALRTLNDHEVYYDELSAHASTAELYNLLGVIQNLRGYYDESLAFNETALKIRKEIFGEDDINVSSSLNNMASVYNQQGKIQKALKMFLKVESNYIRNDFSESLQMANVLLNIGNIYNELIHVEKALDYYKRSLVIRKKLFDKGHPEITTVNQNISNVYTQMGAYNLALEMHQEVLSDYLDTLGSTHYKVGITHMNIGNDYHLIGRHKQAIESYQKAISIIRKSVGENHPEIAQLYNNIGEAYAGDKQRQLAIDYLKRSIALRKQTIGDEYVEIGESQFNLGGIYEAVGDFEKATDFYERSLETYQKNIGDKSPLISKVCLQLANVHLIKENHENAFRYVEKSIDANTIAGQSNSAIEYLDYYILLQSLNLKAELYLQKKSHQANLKALHVYDECNSIIEKLRTLYMMDKDKLQLSDFSKEIYGKAVLLMHQMYLETGLEEYLSRSFVYSEKTKSSVLKAALNDNRARYFGEIPDSLLAEERQIKATISYHQSIINEIKSNKGTDSLLLAVNNTQLTHAKADLRSHISFLEEHFPAYHRLKYKDFEVSLTQVQKSLTQNTSLIQYLDLDSTLVALVVTPDAQYFKKVNLDEEFSELVMTFRTAVEEGTHSVFTQNGFRLYQLLFEQLGILTEKIIVIPDGRTWNINFELLITASSTAGYADLPYLIKDHEITYLYNSDVLLDKETITSRFTDECLAFSYEGNNNGNAISLETVRSANMGDLPGTREEIHEISHLIDGTYYYGINASEGNFKRNAYDFRILHLALHGVVDDESPMNSKLHFSPAEDSLEDNYLHAFEIYNLDLNAELAVLSACNTGVGKLIRGEGVMSLARAFTYAGCKSLVMSQWEVLDATTPAIMKTFYQQLKNGKTKSSALRTAKLAYLDGVPSSLASPHLWGSMIHIGDNSPVYPSNNRRWVLGFVPIILIVSLLYFRKKSVSVG